MANEQNKDFNAMLHKDTGMPKIQIVTDEATIKKYGGEKMFFAPPLAYDEVMKTVPFGKVITSEIIRESRQLIPVDDGFGLLLYFDYDFFPNSVKQRPESKPRGPRKKRKTE